MENIITHQNQQPTSAIIEEQLKTGSVKTDPLHHSHYRATFNAIDLMDRYWYDLQQHHTIHKWQAKYIISVLQVGIINSWTCAKFYEDISLLEWYEKLAHVMTDPSLSLNEL